MSLFPRPQVDESAAYYRRYIDLVPDGDVLAALEAQITTTDDLLRPLPPERGDYRYAPDKWSLKQVIGHIADTERVFTFRALAFARGDHAPIPGMDQDAYVATGGFDHRTLPDLLDELHTIRAATLSLLRHLPPEAPIRRGTASDTTMSARAVPWVIAGHELHHRKILEERYLG